MYVIYYRMEVRVVDMRTFKNWDEFGNWISFIVKYEPITIVGVYDKDTECSEVYKDYAKYVKKYRTGQIVND